MKKILSILILMVASVAAAPSAAAYSAEMAELANLLNEQCTDGVKVSYDGNNIIYALPASFFTDEEREMFSAMEDLQPLASELKQTLVETMGDESLSMFGTILSQFRTNLVVRINLGGAAKDIVFTGEELLAP